MAEESDKSGPESNLELPSLLGFGRKSKRRKRHAAPAAAEPSVEEPTVEASAPEPTPPAAAASPSDPLAADPVEEPRGGLAPAAGAAKRPPPVPPPTRALEPEPVAEPQPEPETQREAQPEAQPVAPPPAPTAESEPEPAKPVPPPPPPRRQSAQDLSEPVAEESPAAGEGRPHEEPLGWPENQPEGQPEEAPAPPGEQPAGDPLGWPPDDAEDEDSDGPPVAAESAAAGRRRAGRTRSGSSFTLPALPPRAGAVLTGALVGLVGVLLAYLAGRGCELVRGVGSCGSIGVVALLLILAVQVLVGAVLLQAWRISDPVSTSFLGVGLVAMFVLLFLLPSLESGWMMLVIPAMSAVAFLFSWWVTTSFIEDTSDTLLR